MSLELKIEALTAAVEANTAALLGAGADVTVTTSKAETKTDAPKPRGRPKKAEAVEDDLGADDDLGGDDGLGADDGLGGDEPQYSFEDVKKLMMSLRDIGGKGANKEDCRTVIQKFKLTNFLELEGQEDKYDEVAALVKQLAKKKKVSL